MNKIFTEDSEIIDEVIIFIKESELKRKTLADYNEQLKATFDSEVQKAAMNILASSSAGVNDGGTSLTYRNN